MIKECKHQWISLGFPSVRAKSKRRTLLGKEVPDFTTDKCKLVQGIICIKCNKTSSFVYDKETEKGVIE